MKKNYGIDMQGPFRAQRVASLPGWTSDDLGREVYLTSNNRRYYGNNSAWVESDVDKIWTHQDTAPTGWSIIAGTTDALLATKGGSNAYNVAGGTQAGTWSMPIHQHLRASHVHATLGHPLSESEMPAHSHTIREVFVQSGVHAFHSGVGLRIASDTEVTRETGGGGNHDHGNTAGGGAGLSDYNIVISTYRPDANVGIVIERN